VVVDYWRNIVISPIDRISQLNNCHNGDSGLRQRDAGAFNCVVICLFRPKELLCLFSN